MLRTNNSVFHGHVSSVTRRLNEGSLESVMGQPKAVARNFSQRFLLVWLDLTLVNWDN